MENKELYDLIEKFLSSIKMSRRKFAKIAGIPPTTFQHKFEVKSKIRSDMYMAIYNAMLGIYLEEQDENKQEILDGIIEEFKTAYQRVDYIDPYIKRIIEAGRKDLENEDENDFHNSDKAWNEYLNHKYSQCYTVSERNCFISIQESLEALNETGKKIAAERVEELTKIPEYRKDNE